ncbi:unnamed protein product [Paramecium sonneborni]|uniref:Uncharacterized protein n=1 Tax=Paramecium sonneborni TaxID=65129 RepID=A0A8S1P5B0_9CILI|nr:unnamed protein product [Paramecium sonneborni]
MLLTINKDKDAQLDQIENMLNIKILKFHLPVLKETKGPCLWIAKYVNADNSLEAFITYDSFKDERTNGEFIQTVSAKEANDTICKQFILCKDTYYLSHLECNSANPNCISDYSTGSIPLAANSTDIQNQCYRNKDGDITSTNLTFTTQAECPSRLKTCRTDGVKCLVKSSFGACFVILLVEVKELAPELQQNLKKVTELKNLLRYSKGFNSISMLRSYQLSFQWYQLYQHTITITKLFVILIFVYGLKLQLQKLLLENALY